MAIKDQLIKLKDNWMLIVIILIALGFLNFGGMGRIGSFSSLSEMSFQKSAVQDAAYSRGYGIMPPTYNGDFAPEVAERKITKSASMSTEAETGAFREAESKLKSIIRSTNSYLLNENSNRYDSGRKSYYTGAYQIKVDSRKYNDILEQLKNIGEVKSFSESAEDVTASYKNLEIELAAEKQRLQRYNQMYQEATLIADKIQLSNSIFEQERMIKYLEDSLKNVDKQVDYSTIYVTITEKQSGYANIVFVKFSELVRRLVASINSLLTLIFVLIPYVIAALIIWFIVRFFRRAG